MKNTRFALVLKPKLIYTFIFFINFSLIQSQTILKNQKSDFWNKVRFGGGLGLSIGNNFSEFFISPSAIYPINESVSLGGGLLGSYTKSNHSYNSFIYGVNAISLFNPLREVQMSLEVEQTRVHTTYETVPNATKKNYWNTGLFVGAGYQNGNVTIGARYNLLFDKDKSIYSDALMPFVRFYF
jgi:hypothetical protein